MRKKRATIYASRAHIAATIALILLPFLFILIFSRIANIATRALFTDVATSFFRLAVAYIIAAILGWVFAASFFRGRRAAVALPIFDVLQSVPAFAALPIATLYWGRTNVVVVLFLVLAVIWPVFFSIISSLKLIRHDWEEAVEIAGLKDFEYLKYFLLPASIPGFITGSIIGLGEGWEALVATEIIVGLKTGVGNFFQAFSSNPAITLFGILGFLLLIFSINKIVWLPLLEWSHRTMEG